MEQLDFGMIDGAEKRPSDDLEHKKAVAADQPLAARMRPRNLEEYAGQQHLLAPGKLLRRAIDADRFSSIILSGPPGTGKTSLAELIALRTDSEFIRLSGVTSTVADLRKEIGRAVMRKQLHGRRTVVFVDELHRFSKSQQDSLLPDVENGNIRLIGATTHNPQFYIVGALLSRSLAFRLEALSAGDIRALLIRTLSDPRGLGGKNIMATDEALDFYSSACEGDARRALNALELASLTTDPDGKGTITISLREAEESIQRKFIVYGDDGHYDTASAFIKSMRGSDPDAAVYWLAKMLHAGEDIRFIARRIVIFASEDVGNADPRAISVAVAAMQAIDMIGMPEARIILSQAVTYCATAPKSNASCIAVNEALEDVENERVQPVPVHLRDSHSADARDNDGKPGEAYKYPHEYDGHFVAQEYMGVPKVYYRPGALGYEEKIRQRLEIWRNAGVIPSEGRCEGE
jgi:putative ATPase